MIGEEKYIGMSAGNDLLVHLFDLMMFCQSWNPSFLSKGVVALVIGHINNAWVGEKFLEDNVLVQHYVYDYTDVFLGYIYVLVH